MCYDTLKTAGWPMDWLLLGPSTASDTIKVCAQACVCEWVCVFEDDYIEQIAATGGSPLLAEVVGKEVSLRRGDR